MSDAQTTAYVALPDAGSGPGVLVLHSWWGLTPGARSICDRLAEEGYVALAPDLFGGAVAATRDEGEQLLADLDPNVLVRDVLDAAGVLARLPATPDGGPIGVLGLSMGASMALWLSDRAADLVIATVAFYGTQDIAFDRTRSAYLCHFAGDDDVVDDDEAAYLEAVLHLVESGRDVDVHRYPGVGHWFFEPDREAFDDAAAELAWTRTLDFLERNLRRGDARP